MDFSFDEEQQQLRETARAFLDEHSDSERVRVAMDSELGYDPQVWKQIGAELGWTAVTIPDAYGGLDLTAVELVALLEVMGESLLCAPYFSSVCLGANALMIAGSEEQKQEHLPAIAEGQSIATLALTEASGRWDAGGIAATARADGGDFVLSGAKRFVLDGHCADLIIVACRAEGTSGSDGVGLFAVSADAVGLERVATPSMDQTRRVADVTLNDVRVPAAAALGDPTGAAGALSQILDLAALGLAAEQVGGAQRTLDMTVAYAKERVQFGRPIGTFQAIKHRCADMMLAVESARSAAYYAACVAAEGSDEFPVNASLAKATASDAFFQCGAGAIQIFGGVGFTWEYDVHLYFKRAKSSEIFLGDPSYHRELVAQRIGL
jgi:alkylation response protein AidB-like acyl-CoA dehydrogenase